MTKTNQFKALAVAAAMALALCLLALATAQPAQAAFPGQNGKIAFQSNRAGNNIHVIDPTGGTATNLTRSDGNSDPAWSPDGSKIAFVSGGTGGNDIFVMNADGTGRKQLPSTGSADSQPAWSPDGEKIAFVSNTFALDAQQDPEIWVTNVDGSEQRPITSNTFPDTQPAWSPDGSKIAFVSARTGDTNRNIYMMNSDGSGQTSITPNSPTGCTSDCYQGHDDDPAWSPDGSRIAYVHGYGPPSNPNAGGGLPNIWTMDPNGGSKTNVSNNPGVSARMPAWSPDGTMIAYVGIESGSSANISVMSANGTAPRAIDTNAANDTNPDWQPIVPKLAVNNVKVKEKAATARFVVSLSIASQQTVTVDYATTNGTAKAPADYAAKAGTLTFSPGETSKTVSVAIKSDRKNERNETFFVDLSNASTTIADGRGKGTIVDND